jgi:hypothetical protein
MFNFLPLPVRKEEGLVATNPWEQWRVENFNPQSKNGESKNFKEKVCYNYNSCINYYSYNNNNKCIYCKANLPTKTSKNDRLKKLNIVQGPILRTHYIIMLFKMAKIVTFVWDFLIFFSSR